MHALTLSMSFDADKDVHAYTSDSDENYQKTVCLLVAAAVKVIKKSAYLWYVFVNSRKVSFYTVVVAENNVGFRKK